MRHYCTKRRETVRSDHGHRRPTTSGLFFGPPSNKPIDITVFDLARVANGQIVEHWGVPDRFALLAQTGVLDRLAR